MAEIVITLPGYRCERCGHEWCARKSKNAPEQGGPPKICPKCKSAWWDTPKRGDAGAVAGG
jgi:predicted Zn-ribbon and HTH transcriptional regulator